MTEGKYRVDGADLVSPLSLVAHTGLGESIMLMLMLTLVMMTSVMAMMIMTVMMMPTEIMMIR